MKKLQSNFTTPEQSKRLLELGVPAWTADEYLDENGLRYSLDGVLDVGLYFQSFPNDTPCWSVGRLIEIYHICVSRGFCFNVCFPNLMNEVMYALTEANNNGWLNLSKLEE